MLCYHLQSAQSRVACALGDAYQSYSFGTYGMVASKALGSLKSPRVTAV